MRQVVKTFSWYVLLVVVLVSTGMGLTVWWRLDQEREYASVECANAAILTAKMVQLNYIEDFRLVASGTVTMDHPSYKRIYQMMIALHHSMPDIKFLYTFVFQDNGKTVRYLVDSEPMDSPEWSVLGETDPADYPSFREYYKRSDLPFRSHVLERDPKWGTFISGYSPIVDPNGVVLGHVAADISAETIWSRYYSVLLLYGCLGVSLSTLIIFFAWLVVIRYSRRRELEMAACAALVDKNLERIKKALNSEEFCKVPDKTYMGRSTFNSSDISE